MTQMLNGRGMSAGEMLRRAREAQAAALAGDVAKAQAISATIGGAPRQVFSDISLAGRAGEQLRAGDVEGAQATMASMTAGSIHPQVAQEIATTAEARQVAAATAAEERFWKWLAAGAVSASVALALLAVFLSRRR